MLMCAFFYPLHMRPRVQRASGIPCALCFEEGERYLQTSGGTCRENEEPYPLGSPARNPEGTPVDPLLTARIALISRKQIPLW